MPTPFRITCVALILLFALCVFACSKAPQQPAPATTETPNAEPRLAVLSPAIAVMLRDLGLEDQIVAKHDYDLILSDTIPAAGSELGFDLEVLINAHPTHVFFQRTSAERSSKFNEIAQEQGWIIFERPLETLDDIATTMDDLYYMFKGFPERQPRQYDMSEALDHTLPSAALADAWSDLGPDADAAGRVLILGSVDPIGAMGPGSYHHQIIERLGAIPAITEGAMWIELDFEDLITLNPDAIILIAPRRADPSDDSQRFGTPTKPTLAGARAALGPIADLPINATRNNHLAVIDHPLGLLPCGAMGQVAEDIADQFAQWNK